jgi:hypothetical protein
MSKLFFDGLFDLNKVEAEIKKVFPEKETREETESFVGDIIHDKVFDKILENLPKDYHIEFLELYHKCPYDEEIIFTYLKGKAGKDIKETLKKELENIDSDILKEIRPQDEVSVESQVPKK